MKYNRVLTGGVALLLLAAVGCVPAGLTGFLVTGVLTFEGFDGNHFNPDLSNDTVQREIGRPTEFVFDQQVSFPGEDDDYVIAVDIDGSEIWVTISSDTSAASFTTVPFDISLTFDDLDTDIINVVELSDEFPTTTNGLEFAFTKDTVSFSYGETEDVELGGAPFEFSAHYEVQVPDEEAMKALTLNSAG